MPPATATFDILLLDGGGSSLANHLVLRTGATGAADCADELSAFHERDPAARGDDAIQRERVVSLLQLNVVLEHPRFAAKARGRACFMLRHCNRGELRAVHALEGHQ